MNLATQLCHDCGSPASYLCDICSDPLCSEHIISTAHADHCSTCLEAEKRAIDAIQRIGKIEYVRESTIPLATFLQDNT